MPRKVSDATKLRSMKAQYKRVVRELQSRRIAGDRMRTRINCLSNVEAIRDWSGMLVGDLKKWDFIPKEDLLNAK